MDVTNEIQRSNFYQDMCTVHAHRNGQNNAYFIEKLILKQMAYIYTRMFINGATTIDIQNEHHVLGYSVVTSRG